MHQWRTTVVDVWFGAHHAWWLDREATAIGYRTEQQAYAADHPEPALRPVLVGLAGGGSGITAYTLAGQPDLGRRA